MEPIYTSCCGLDVHRRSVQACVRRLRENGSIHQETCTFGTMTRDILEMADSRKTESAIFLQWSILRLTARHGDSHLDIVFLMVVN
jgi:hypothetical protein